MPAQTHTLAHAHTHTHTLPQMGHLLGDPLRDLGWFRLLCETGHIAESRVTDVSAGQFSGGPSPDSSPTHPADAGKGAPPRCPTSSSTTAGKPSAPPLPTLSRASGQNSCLCQTTGYLPASPRTAQASLRLLPCLKTARPEHTGQHRRARKAFQFNPTGVYRAPRKLQAL